MNAEKPKEPSIVKNKKEETTVEPEPKLEEPERLKRPSNLIW